MLDEKCNFPLWINKTDEEAMCEFPFVCSLFLNTKWSIDTKKKKKKNTNLISVFPGKGSDQISGVLCIQTRLYRASNTQLLVVSLFHLQEGRSDALHRFPRYWPKAIKHLRFP